MKKKELLFLVGLLTIIMTFFGCKKKETEDTKDTKSEDKILVIAKDYLANELKIKDVVSVQNLRTDTLNKYEYTRTALNMLDKLEGDYLLEIQSAMDDGNKELASEKEQTLSGIKDAINYYTEMQQEIDPEEPFTFLFFVSGVYHTKDSSEQFGFFLRPNFQVYTPDLFDLTFLDE